MSDESPPALPVRSRPRGLGRTAAQIRHDHELAKIARRFRRLDRTLDDPRMGPALRVLARVHSLAEEVTARLADMGLLDEDGELKPSLEMARRLADTEMRLLGALGLTPAAMRAGRARPPIDFDAVYARIEEARRARYGDEGDEQVIEPSETKAAEVATTEVAKTHPREEDDPTF